MIPPSLHYKVGVASHLLHVEEHEGGNEDDKREKRRVEKSKPATETNKIMNPEKNCTKTLNN